MVAAAKMSDRHHIYMIWVLASLPKIIIRFLFYICHFHLTISPGMPGGPWKQTNKQTNRIFRVRRKWNILKASQCEVLCFLNLVTRWPAEPGGPLLPGRPGNPGTPSVPGGPCHIKTLWSLLENEITDIRSKAQLTPTVAEVLWDRIEYKWKTFDTLDLWGQSSCVSIYCNWVKERWKLNKLWINLTSPYRFQTDDLCSPTQHTFCRNIFSPVNLSIFNTGWRGCV